ncbi:MAG: hypothetical protein Q4F65_00220 [Propionibacteriaceae bacterium]|nr:hypothetical protein [Propionibacteriaceae bacterium]
MNRAAGLIAGLKWASSLFVVAAAWDDGIRLDHEPWVRVAILIGYAALLGVLWWPPAGVILMVASVPVVVVTGHFIVLAVTAPLVALGSAARGRGRLTAITVAATIVTAVVAQAGGEPRPYLLWILIPLVLLGAAMGAGIWALRVRRLRAEASLAAISELQELGRQAERADMARHLHDQIGGALASASMIAAAEEDSADPATARSFSEIRLACAQAAHHLGIAVAQLREQDVPAVRAASQPSTRVQQLSEMLRRCGISVEVEWDDRFDRYPMAVRTLIDHFLTEGCTNVLKHGGVGTAVRLAAQADTGGFSIVMSSSTQPSPEGHTPGTGLRTLREAALALDATVTWTATETDWTLRLDGDLLTMLGVPEDALQFPPVTDA